MLVKQPSLLKRISSRCDDFFHVGYSRRKWFLALAERAHHIEGITPA